MSTIPRARAALERFLPAWKPQRVTYRAVGIGMAADVEPAIMMKLPLPFKQMGMSVHRDFDAIADGIGTSRDRLSNPTTAEQYHEPVHNLSRYVSVVGEVIKAL